MITRPRTRRTTLSTALLQGRSGEDSGPKTQRRQIAKMMERMVNQTSIPCTAYPESSERSVADLGDATPTPDSQKKARSSRPTLRGDPAQAWGSTVGPDLLLRAFLTEELRYYSNTTVLFPKHSTRCCRCQRTARERTTLSRSLPFSINASGLSRCDTRITSCSMMAPSSRTSVT